MAINSVKTIEEEQSFKFLENQSSILRTIYTNNITYKGVNVIVDKPKAGDVMCVTLYKDANDNLLDSSRQKVVWIDGKTINSLQLDKLYDIVGICLSVKGNKAIVKYKYNIHCNKFSTAARHRIFFENYLNGQYSVVMSLPGNTSNASDKYTFTFTGDGTMRSIVNQFNAFYFSRMKNAARYIYAMEERDGYAFLNCIYNDNLDVEKTNNVTFNIAPIDSMKYIIHAIL